MAFTVSQILNHLLALGYISSTGQMLNHRGIYDEAVKYDIPSGELARALASAGNQISGAHIRNWILAMGLPPLPADVALGITYTRLPTPIVVTTVSPTPAPSPAPAPGPAPAPAPAGSGGWFPGSTTPDYLTQPQTDANGNVVGDMDPKKILLFGGLGLAALLLLRRRS